MDWIVLISGVGLGTIIGTVLGKILDARLLYPITQKAAHTEWLRNQRLAAYSAAAEDFLSFGLSRKITDNPFEGYEKIAKSLILADDDNLAKEIDQYLVELDQFHKINEDSAHEDEATRRYEQLIPKARALIAKMRRSLTKI